MHTAGFYDVSALDCVGLVSAATVATASVVLACLQVPRYSHRDKLSQARWVLAATYAVLALSGFYKVSLGHVVQSPLVLLCVASFQALLFTYSSSVLIAPGAFSPRRLTAILVCILFGTVVLVLSNVFLLRLYAILWPVALVAYVLQMIVHTVTFTRLANRVQENLESYYDEDVTRRLYPVKGMFYSALFIGVLAFCATVMPLTLWTYNGFVISYTIYYLYVAVMVVNYSVYGRFFMQAADYEMVSESVGGSDDLGPLTNPELRAALASWVDRRGYLDTDMGTDLIAEELGVNRQQLAAYMRAEYGMTFRSWRLRLRLQYAQKLIASGKIKLPQVYEHAGFSDRSNFYKEFSKFSGMTPQAYQDKYSHRQ
ncbi:MAG: helix-turn-helix domain-containing protein [Bacteroidaceae bacterium]